MALGPADIAQRSAVIGSLCLAVSFNPLAGVKS
jgi:hypothetical protein